MNIIRFTYAALRATTPSLFASLLCARTRVRIYIFFSYKNRTYARPYRGTCQLNDTARRFLRKIDRSARCGENKNKFPHTYALLELPSKDNSLAAEGPSRCVMRDFIAVTGIGRGHRAHALSPRFCLTDYFIYGQRVYIRGRASWLCARRRALKSACKTLLPAIGLDKNSRCVWPPPSSVQVSDHTLEFVWKEKKKGIEARTDDAFDPRLTCACARVFCPEKLFFYLPFSGIKNHRVAKIFVCLDLVDIGNLVKICCCSGIVFFILIVMINSKYWLRQ